MSLNYSDRASRAQKTRSGTSDRRGLSTPKKQYGKSQEEVDKIAEDNKAIAKSVQDAKLMLKKTQNQQKQNLLQKNRKAAAQHPWFSKS
jgi:DNA-binding ferritin-like protein